MDYYINLKPKREIHYNHYRCLKTSWRVLYDERLQPAWPCSQILQNWKDVGRTELNNKNATYTRTKTITQLLSKHTFREITNKQDNRNLYLPPRPFLFFCFFFPRAVEVASPKNLEGHVPRGLSHEFRRACPKSGHVPNILKGMSQRAGMSQTV